MTPPPAPSGAPESVPGIDLLPGVPPPAHISPESTDTWGDTAVSRAWNQVAVFTSIDGYNTFINDADLPTILALSGAQLSEQAKRRLSEDFPGYRRYSAAVRSQGSGPVTSPADPDAQAWLSVGGLIAAPNWKDLTDITDISVGSPTITTWKDGGIGGLVIRFTTQAIALYGDPDPKKSTPWPIARDTTMYLIPNPDNRTQSSTPWLIHDWTTVYAPGNAPWTAGHNHIL